MGRNFRLNVQLYSNAQAEGGGFRIEPLTKSEIGFGLDPHAPLRGQFVNFVGVMIAQAGAESVNVDEVRAELKGLVALTDSLEVVDLDATAASLGLSANQLVHLYIAAPHHPPEIAVELLRDTMPQLRKKYVFIGHGGSREWLELRAFLQDRLGLHCDEFNRTTPVGLPVVQRLREMLDRCSFAFLVLTGEDVRDDGTLHPRENVVHELGLFQGRLGFEKAVAMLEDGTQEFSNIAGLGQIRFPRGKISNCFEEVRRVLERENIIRE